MLRSHCLGLVFTGSCSTCLSDYVLPHCPALLSFCSVPWYYCCTLGK